MNRSFIIPHHRPWEDALLRSLAACGWCDGFRLVPEHIELSTIFWNAFMPAAQHRAETETDPLATHLAAFLKAISHGNEEELRDYYVQRALFQRGFTHHTVKSILEPGESSLGDLARSLDSGSSYAPNIDFARTVHTMYFCGLKSALEAERSSLKEAS